MAIASRGSKAACIRAAFGVLGLGASVGEVQEHCRKSGHKHVLLDSQISSLRQKLKVKGKKSPKKSSPNGEILAHELIEARVSAEKLGGVVRAKAVMDILHQLLST